MIRRHPETGERHLDPLRWGLLPRWIKDPKGAKQPIKAYAKRRCLVPEDAFYEWKAEPGGKQPMAVAPRSGEGMAFAGLWEHWRGEADEIVRTFAIITTDANTPLQAVHDRMPTILAPGDWAAWLEDEGPGRPAATRAG